MNKFGVLTTNVKTHFMRRLTEEVGDKLLILDPRSQTFDLERVLVRTTGIRRDDADLTYLNSLDSSFIYNPLVSLKTFRSKTSQYEFFAAHKVPHLPWRDLSTGELPIDAATLLEPGHSSFLVKPRFGQGGWGVQKLSLSEFQSWWREQKKCNDTDYVLQPFFENAQEYRVLFVADFRFCLSRMPSKGVAANFQNGGDAKITSLPSDCVPIIEVLIKKSGAFYGAIDLLVRDDQAVVLELNVVPGVEQAETLSGLNLVGRIANDFISLTAQTQAKCQ